MSNPTFICASCGTDFQSARPDAMAQHEFELLTGQRFDEIDVKTVCTDCFSDILYRQELDTFDAETVKHPGQLN